ncbi:cAMP-dependent kinase type II-alpha regulatory subunit [Pelobates cultripes]|uniref:cAMP-dependent protein kinase type II-alpha regulatory subunit n=1 Tax=Pelobates cultripes TaxID=61616 RepID=A0AAD1WKX8_PELCU|nr:cAMP-dependent kinase type II-alpha regulatory subunit [Pelobates cultripes]
MGTYHLATGASGVMIHTEQYWVNFTHAQETAAGSNLGVRRLFSNISKLVLKHQLSTDITEEYLLHSPEIVITDGVTFHSSKDSDKLKICAEAFNPDEEDEDTEPRVVHPKTDEQRCRLQESCKDILLFKNLDQEQLSQVLDAMFELRVKPQEHVIDQGDDGDNFYVVERGLYDIFVERDGQSRCVGRYDNHGSFGELALMYNTPRAATIVATTDGALWGLDRVTFRRIILKNNARKRKMFENFVESVPILKSLECSERMKIVDVLGEKIYKDGDRIIAQGDLADCFFIVESGEVKIMMKSKTKTTQESNQEVEITRCTRGQYFGELALVTNKPRAASAYAVGDVKCLVMDVQAFERLLGPCMDIMKRNITHYEEQLMALFGSSMDLRDPGK